VDIALDELRGRVGDEGLTLLDVRSPVEFTGEAGAPCDPRQGHIPGARNLPLEHLLACCSVADVLRVIGLPEGAEVVAYCHTGQRSAIAAQILRAAGYDGRNYVGSWHEWSRDPALPVEAARSSS
jgi:thiosulfate/3-mercaptopyruvate sulfurtransferase